MPPSPAQHMASAMKLFYDANNSSPHHTRYPRGGFALHTGERDPWANFAVGLDVSEIPAAAKLLSASTNPSMVVWPGPRRTDVESALAPHGYMLSSPTPAMQVSLETLTTPPLPTGFRIERVTNRSDPHEWALGLSVAYPISILAAQSMSPVHVAISDAPNAPIQFFTLRNGADLVGTTVLVLADGLAGVYCVSTMPAFRRQGLGAFLAAFPLGVARALGYKTGVLQASETGYPIYRRLGFEDADQVQIYLRIPPEPSA